MSRRDMSWLNLEMFRIFQVNFDEITTLSLNYMAYLFIKLPVYMRARLGQGDLKSSSATYSV